MRREILRAVSREELTAGKLAASLGLTAPTISHHLERLIQGGLVELTRSVPEAHGILQKFYQASAQAYIVDPQRLSPLVRRYFVPARIERTRGMMAALALMGEPGFKPSFVKVETATDELAWLALEAAERRKGPCHETDPEFVIHDIYKEALKKLLVSKPEILPRLS